MRILVTGAAGFIGSHLAERLARMGHDVVGLDSFTNYYSRALKESNARDVEAAGARILRMDLATDDLGSAAEGAEVIYHLAAQPGISASTPLEDYIRNNIVATHRIVEAALRCRSLRLFVNVSTSSVYGAHATDPEDVPPKPTSYYGVTKLAAEQLALAYQREKGLPVCSLRLFSVYGPRERPEKLYHRLIRSIVKNEPFPVYEGSEAHTRSYTYVEDALAGILAVLDRAKACVGEIFNIGTDQEIATGEGIRIIEEILGRPAQKVIMPRRPGDQIRTRANIQKARAVLGYAPTTPPRVGLEAEVRWYLEKVHGRVPD